MSTFSSGFHKSFKHLGTLTLDLYPKHHHNKRLRRVSSDDYLVKGQTLQRTDKPTRPIQTEGTLIFSQLLLTLELPRNASTWLSSFHLDPTHTRCSTTCFDFATYRRRVVRLMSGSQIWTLHLNSQLFSERTYMAERQKVKPKVYGFLVEAPQVLSSSLSLKD
ncbi:hypothetical protein N7513_011941 [Penicillium frequentans]|nr:hypothetical protein N7513_011941 [Penicillium glabrum]